MKVLFKAISIILIVIFANMQGSFSQSAPEKNSKLITYCPSNLTEIAGTYYQGDDKGFNLDLFIKSNGTFLEKCRGCLGTYGTAFGTATLKQGKLILDFKNCSGQYRYTRDHEWPKVLIPVHYGAGDYLLTEDQIVQYNKGPRLKFLRDEWYEKRFGPIIAPPFKR